MLLTSLIHCHSILKSATRHKSKEILGQGVAPDVVPLELGTFLHRAVRITVPLRFWLHVRFWHLADIEGQTTHRVEF
jgi:hypothetical protein